MSGSNIVKISKNAFFLYLRTGISMIIQFIAVRYLLKYLGEDGYGLYGLIGSIVAVIVSLKGLLAASVQRFFNIAIGENDEDAIKDIFNAAFIIHLGLGLLLALLTLLLGIIMIPSLDIPKKLIVQAWWVLIFSAATSCIEVLAVPYYALITSYEKFNIYAYLSIVEQVLKLIIVIILVFIPSFRIAVYAGLLFCVCIIMRLLYIGVAKLNFREIVTLRRVNNKNHLKLLLSFAGFAGIGTISKTIKDSGLNFIINIFGGLLVNTARTISYQVMSAVNVLVWNINFAFMPKIVTLYGEKRFSEYELLVQRMSKFTLTLNISMAFSISVLIYPILNIWLGSIPPYTSLIVCLILLDSVARTMIDSISSIFTSEGRVKQFQLIPVLSMILVLIGSWIVLKSGYSIYWGFGILVIVDYLGMITSCLLVYLTSSFNIKLLIKRTLFPALICILLCSLLVLFLQAHIPRNLNLTKLAVLMIILFILCGIFILRMLVSQNEWRNILNYGRSLIRKVRM